MIDDISVGNSPFGVAVNPNTNLAYVANSNSSTVSVIDGKTNSVIATIPVGNSPFGVAVNPNTNLAYVAATNSHLIYVIDGNTNSVVKNITVDLRAA